jgi:Uma2 family endonuclease
LSVPEVKAGTKYSYADYLQWDDEQRWELIDGVPYKMTFDSPEGSLTHQEVLGNIFALFHHYLLDKPGGVFVAPFDVRLSEKEQDQETFHVVQPDISIICDRYKMDQQGCKGAPDLIVEILSLGTAITREKRDKFRLYERHGVREYWIVDPFYEMIEVYHLQENRFGAQQWYTKGDVIQVSIFEDCQVNLHHVFHPTFATE